VRYRKEWCQCQSRTWKGPGSRGRAILHLPIPGRGGSTVRNPSKDLLIPGNENQSDFSAVMRSRLLWWDCVIRRRCVRNWFGRGYYRCSSSKGCPARKQVERSRLDPTMLVVTYSCEHNHAWPASRSHHNQSTTPKTEKPEPIPDKQLDQETTSSAVLADLGDESLMLSDEFGWFSDMETTSSTVLESPIFAESSVGGVSDVAMFFPMREEDESLYADLGELPECSVVFRGVGPGVEIY
jgi:hypothetical protein